MRREGRRIDDEVLAHVSPAHIERQALGPNAERELVGRPVPRLSDRGCDVDGHREGRIDDPPGLRGELNRPFFEHTFDRMG